MSERHWYDHPAARIGNTLITVTAAAGLSACGSTTESPAMQATLAALQQQASDAQAKASTAEAIAADLKAHATAQATKATTTPEEELPAVTQPEATATRTLEPTDRPTPTEPVAPAATAKPEITATPEAEKANIEVLLQTEAKKDIEINGRKHTIRALTIILGDSDAHSKYNFFELSNPAVGGKNAPFTQLLKKVDETLVLAAAAAATQDNGITESQLQAVQAMAQYRVGDYGLSVLNHPAVTELKPNDIAKKEAGDFNEVEAKGNLTTKNIEAYVQENIVGKNVDSVIITASQETFPEGSQFGNILAELQAHGYVRAATVLIVTDGDDDNAKLAESYMSAPNLESLAKNTTASAELIAAVAFANHRTFPAGFGTHISSVVQKMDEDIQSGKIFEPTPTPTS